MRTPRLGWTAALTVMVTAAALAAAPAETAVAAPPPSAAPSVAYQDLSLPGGRHATVYTDGLAEVSGVTKDGKRGTEFRWIPLLGSDGAAPGLPSKNQIAADLASGPAARYRPDEVVAVYGDSVSAPTSFSAPASATRAAAVPHYTSDAGLNSTLAGLGVDRSRQLFTGQDVSQLSAQRAAASQALGRPLLDFAHGFVLLLNTASVPAAVTALRANPTSCTRRPTGRSSRPTRGRSTSRRTRRG